MQPAARRGQYHGFKIWAIIFVENRAGLARRSEGCEGTEPPLDVQNKDSAVSRSSVAGGPWRRTRSRGHTAIRVNCGAGVGHDGTRRYISYLMFQSFKVQTNTCHGPRIMSSTCYGRCRLNRSFLTFLLQTACHGHNVHVTRDKE